jgi:hypothetical protein
MIIIKLLFILSLVLLISKINYVIKIIIKVLYNFMIEEV